MVNERRAGLDKWQMCIHHGSFAEPSTPPPPDELKFRPNYLCFHPSVIANPTYPKYGFNHPKESRWVQSAKLSGPGTESDPTVLNALNKSCKACPFYR